MFGTGPKFVPPLTRCLPATVGLNIRDHPVNMGHPKETLITLASTSDPMLRAPAHLRSHGLVIPQPTWPGRCSPWSGGDRGDAKTAPQPPGHHTEDRESSDVPACCLGPGIDFTPRSSAGRR